MQLSRSPRKLPILNIKRKVDSIFDFKFEDFEIINYDPHPHIKGKVSIQFGTEFVIVYGIDFATGFYSKNLYFKLNLYS